MLYLRFQDLDGGVLIRPAPMAMFWPAVLCPILLWTQPFSSGNMFLLPGQVPEDTEVAHMTYEHIEALRPMHTHPPFLSII
jgi:hypothetical protein